MLTQRFPVELGKIMIRLIDIVKLIVWSSGVLYVFGVKAKLRATIFKLGVNV